MAEENNQQTNIPATSSPIRLPPGSYFQVVHNIVDGATTANYDHFFTANVSCEVIQAYETHRVKGTDAGAVTLTIEKLNSTEALDAGDEVLATTFNLKGDNNTVQRVKATTTELSRVLNPGDRLALKDSGTPTAVAGVQITVLMRVRSSTIDPTA